MKIDVFADAGKVAIGVTFGDETSMRGARFEPSQIRELIASLKEAIKAAEWQALGQGVAT